MSRPISLLLQQHIRLLQGSSWLTGQCTVPATALGSVLQGPHAGLGVKPLSLFQCCAASSSAKQGQAGSSSSQPGTGPSPASRLNTWRGPAGQPPPPPPSNAAGAAAAAGAAGIQHAEGPVMWLGAQNVALGAVPAVPKFLGFAGALPFLTLTPYVLEGVNFHGLVPFAAKAQVMYGCFIVTFLGAIHWGLAMHGSMAGARNVGLARERYVWSVFPCLAAWPVSMMEPGPASVAVAVLLGLCYLSDRSYAKLGSLPAWYMTLRGWLTFLSTISMLATAQYYFAKDVQRAKEQVALEEAALQQQRDQEAAAAVAAARAADALAEQQRQAQAQASKKKGWW